MVLIRIPKEKKLDYILVDGFVESILFNITVKKRSDKQRYNKRHSGKERVWKYSIHFMYERLDMGKMDGSRYPPAKETIWNHMCYEK